MNIMSHRGNDENDEDRLNRFDLEMQPNKGEN